MDLNIEIYIKNLKKYLLTNEDSRKYFLGESLNVEDFIIEVSKVAQENVKQGKDPQLTKIQFEKIKSKFKTITFHGKAPIFLFNENYPPLFLN